MHGTGLHATGFACVVALATILLWGCDTTRPPKPTSTITDAIKAGDVEAVRSHLYWDAPTGDRGYNLSLLPLAASYGHDEVVALMLDTGIPVSPKLKPPRPLALHYAAAKGHTSTVQLLLDRGAVVDQVDEYGKTPLVWAAETGQLACVKLLLAAGADPAHRSRYGTATDAAVKNGHDAVAAWLGIHQGDASP